MKALDLWVRLPDEGISWNVGGRVTTKIGSEETDGAYAMLELLLPPQGGAPRHVHHREDEIFYIVEGECEIISETQNVRATPGTWVQIPKGTPHTFRNPGDTPCKILITVVPGGLDQYFAEIGALLATGEATQEKLAEINQRYEIDFSS